MVLFFNRLDNNLTEMAELYFQLFVYLCLYFKKGFLEIKKKYCQSNEQGNC